MQKNCWRDSPQDDAQHARCYIVRSVAECKIRPEILPGLLLASLRAFFAARGGDIMLFKLNTNGLYS